MQPDDLEIVRRIQDAAQEDNKIPASQVRSWLGNGSLDVIGAVVEHIIRDSQKVEPPLSIEEICSTVQGYYRQCLVLNLQDSDYAPNRSIAGMELVGWFQSLWRDSTVPREYLFRLKSMLRELCIENEVPQDQMVGAVLEHLFETPEIAEFFSDWRTDSRLKRAYDLAMEWAEDHRPSNPPQA